MFYSWTTPLGIFLSCLLATVTSSFENALGLSPDSWKTFFVIGTVVSFIWLLVCGYRALNNRNDRGIEHLIEEIKNTESKQQILFLANAYAMAKLKNINGHFVESDYENALIAFLEREGWQYLFRDVL